MSNIFRKKKDELVLIEAEQYSGTNNPYGALKDHKCNYRMCPLCGGDDHEHKYIDSIPGPIIVKIGDYVVRHPNGFLDTVGAERFEKIYELEFPAPIPSPKDQPEGQKTLRWVKASNDTLPEEDGQICVRSHGVDYSAAWVRTRKDGSRVICGMATQNSEWPGWRKNLEILKEETSSPAAQPLETRYRPFTGKEIGTIKYNPESGDLRIEPYDDDVHPTQSAPANQGEIPEEIRNWMNQHAEADADDDVTLWYNGARGCYHKMQEEIKEYRKAMERIRDELGMNTTANHVIHMHAIVKELLDKYPHS